MSASKEIPLPPMTAEQLDRAVAKELFGIDEKCDQWGRNIGTRKQPEYMCRKCGKWSELHFTQHATRDKAYSSNPQDTQLVMEWLQKHLKFFRLLYTRTNSLCHWSVNTGDYGCVDTIAYGTTWMNSVCRAALVVSRTEASHAAVRND